MGEPNGMLTIEKTDGRRKCPSCGEENKYMNLQIKETLLVIIQEFTEKNIAVVAVDRNGEKNNLRKGLYLFLFFTFI